MSPFKPRHPEGNIPSGSLLTEDQVREIRARYAAGGVSYRALEVEYGVSRSAINSAVRRLTYRWIDQPAETAIDPEEALTELVAVLAAEDVTDRP